MKKSVNLSIFLVFMLLFTMLSFQPNHIKAAESTPSFEMEPIFLTDQNGDLVVNPSAGTFVIPNIFISNNSSNPATTPLIGVLEIVAYNSNQTVATQTAIPVNQSTARNGYSTVGFAYPEGGYIKATLKDSLNTAVLLAEPITYPEYAEATVIIYKAPLASFAALASAYPAPADMWTAMTKDTGNIYTYHSSSSSWDQVSDTATTALYISMSKNGPIAFPDTFSSLPFTISRTGTRTYSHNATPQNQYDWSGATEIFLSTSVTTAGSTGLGTSSSAPITGARFITNFTSGLYGTQTKFIFTIKDNMYTGTTVDNLIPIVSTGVHALVRSGSPSGFSWVGRVRRQGNNAEITTNWTAGCIKPFKCLHRQ